MSTSSKNNSEDDRWLEELRSKMPVDGYKQHMKQRSAGLSVDVLNQLNKQQPSFAFVRVFSATVAVTIATVVAVMYWPASSEQQTIDNKPVAAVSSIDEQTTAATLEVLITEEAINSIVPSKPVKTTILSDADIDAFLEEL